MHSWLDQLLRPLLQISSLLHIEADRRPSDTLGSTQVQTPTATTEARENMVGWCGQTHAVALPPLAASVCKRPDAGSRMSREAHVRFWERAVVKFRRATRLVALSEQHLRRFLKSYATYYNTARTHRALGKDAPVSRPVQRIGRIVSHALVGGLHHQYVRI